MSLFPYSRNSHFAFSATTVYCQLPLLRSFSAFVPEPKNRMRPAEPLPEPNGHDLPHFEAISQTPLPQLPSVVQIGFAWLPRLSGRQRQSQNPPQHACEQAPRQMALWEVGMALA
jgi:cytochrome c peroxidase